MAKLRDVLIILTCLHILFPTTVAFIAGIAIATDTVLSIDNPEHILLAVEHAIVVTVGLYVTVGIGVVLASAKKPRPKT